MPNILIKTNFASLELRAKALSLCTFFFFSIYVFAGFYAESQNISQHFLFPGEENIPFIAWFIIPYTSSSFLFVYQFYLSTDQNNLRLLTYRILFVTICAGLCYFIFPLAFKFEKPAVPHKFLDFLVHLFKSYDNKYNQAPSLHVAFAGLFYSVILQQNYHWFSKFLWLIWVILIMLSTIFVYQHHVIDIITAILLIAITLLILPNHDRIIYILKRFKS